MSTLQVEYRTDQWLRLGAAAGERDQVIAIWLESAPDWTATDLASIIALSASAPTVTADAERFLLVREDRTWFVLEVSHHPGGSASLDPETDFGDQVAETVRLSPQLAGYRLITMDSAGPIEGLEGDKGDLLLPRLHYFLEFAGGDRGWVYAGMQVADPMALPVIVPLVEELLAGVGTT